MSGRGKDTSQKEVFWVLAPCSVAVQKQCFGGLCCISLQGEVKTSTLIFTAMKTSNLVAGICPYTKESRPILGDHPASYPMGAGDFSPGCKAGGA